MRPGVKRSWLATACGIGLAMALGGCAHRSEVRVPNRAAQPHGTKAFEGAAGDVRLRHPSNWQARPGPPPYVLSVYSGPAVVSVFAYRRRAVPSIASDLAIARANLVKVARRRDPTFRAFTSRVRRIGGTPAVDVHGIGTVAGRRVRIHSVHLFKRRGEYVVDCLAPLKVFSKVNGSVFAPLIDSVRVKGAPPRATATAGERRTTTGSRTSTRGTR